MDKNKLIKCNMIIMVVYILNKFHILITIILINYLITYNPKGYLTKLIYYL